MFRCRSTLDVFDDLPEARHGRRFCHFVVPSCLLVLERDIASGIDRMSSSWKALLVCAASCDVELAAAIEVKMKDEEKEVVAAKAQALLAMHEK